MRKIKNQENFLYNIAPAKGNKIPLTDALLKLKYEETMYAFDFKGRRDDAGDKQGFLKETVGYALRRL